MTIPNLEKLDLRVLFYQEGTNWIAQCIEFDVNAHGHDIASAQDAFFRAFAASLVIHIQNHKDPLTSIPKAPVYFANRFEQARQQQLAGEATWRLPASLALPAPHVIHAIERRIDA